jgi:hypothetical protein
VQTVFEEQPSAWAPSQFQRAVPQEWMVLRGLQAWQRRAREHLESLMALWGSELKEVWEFQQGQLLRCRAASEFRGFQAVSEQMWFLPEADWEAN